MSSAPKRENGAGEAIRHAAGVADVGQIGGVDPTRASYEPKWDGFRSICFRDARSGGAGQPQRTADDQLLPRTRRGGHSGWVGNKYGLSFDH